MMTGAVCSVSHKGGPTTEDDGNGGSWVSVYLNLTCVAMQCCSGTRWLECLSTLSAVQHLTAITDPLPQRLAGFEDKEGALRERATMNAKDQQGLGHCV